MGTPNLRAIGDRIEALVEEMGRLADPRAAEQSAELVRLLMEFYGAGLARVVELAGENPAGTGFARRLADDPLVASLLVLHGLHPEDTETRVRRALDGVRPYLGSHGGGVLFLGIEDGVARLSLEGSCEGCPSSLVTVKLAIERAIEEAAPEVSRVEVEGVSEPAPSSPLIQIQTRGGRAHGSEAIGRGGEWVTLDPPPTLAPDGLTALELAGARVVVCRVGESFYAYRDACACGALLAGSVVAEGVLTCGACRHRFDVRAAGRSTDGALNHLDPFPLLADGGAIRIAVPASVGAA